MNPHNWTLRARLIALMVVLVGITSIAIGGVAFLVLKSALSEQFDLRLLSDAQSLINRSPATSPVGQENSLTVGQIIGYTADDGSHAAVEITSVPMNGDPVTRDLTSADATAIASAAARAGGNTVRLETLGEYRVVKVPTRFDPNGFVLGEPSSGLEKQLAGDLGKIALVVIGAILLAVLLGIFVFGRALRPLRRVANVASNVAALPLERDDVDLAQRVPQRDTNPNTEVGQVGAALNALLDSVGSALAVRQASEEKVRHFVADASHELRTPLASIRGYAELTRRFGGELSDDVQHNIGRIESEAKRMTRLVEDLLLLARLDAERELDTSDVDLSRLLVDVVSDAHAAGRDHEWDFELPDEPVIVRGDEAKLQQVFTNLLANARVHTPAGTHVVVDLQRPVGEHVVVQVRDDGPGIPEELQPQLFGRFVRGDSSRNRNTGSTGLGLSIVSAVVQAHHGSVSVVSEPGATTFTVQLPVHQPAAAAPTPREPVPA